MLFRSTWNGNAIPYNYGGTTLTTFSGANNAIYSTSATALTAGTLPVAAGGTGSTSLTANNVLLGNGTSALQAVAPSTSGNVLTSNGTTWQSSALSAVTSVATGNGLSGGTITTTGTLAIAAPSFNSVGSYVWGTLIKIGRAHV